MKKLILLATLFFVACNVNDKPQNAENDTLKGKVKSVREVTYIHNLSEEDSLSLVDNYITETFTEYNEKGSVIYKYSNLLGGNRFETITYERDEDDKILKMFIDNAKDSLKIYNIFKYNEKGLNTEIVAYSQTDSILETHKYTYNEQGKIIEEVATNGMGETKFTIKNEYDNNGTLRKAYSIISTGDTMKTEYDENGKTLDKNHPIHYAEKDAEIIYDEQGNWIEKRNVTDPKRRKKTIKRTIEYYKQADNATTKA